MTGGIYCEVPLRGYNERTLGSVRERMKKLLGLDPVPPDTDLNEEIINYWYKKVSKKMSSILSSWRVPGNRGYFNRTVDLTRSICLGVYHNGVLKRIYRFTGGRTERESFSPSEWGSGMSMRTQSRMSWLSLRHPNPATRVQQFLTGYKLIQPKGFVLVIAATMPYAVRLEKRMAIPVLSLVINRILQSVYEFGSGRPFYGYIFEKTGSAETGDEPIRKTY